MEKLNKIVHHMKYLVISEDGEANIYSSLREIAKDIHVNYSTISKKFVLSLGKIV